MTTRISVTVLSTLLLGFSTVACGQSASPTPMQSHPSRPNGAGVTLQQFQARHERKMLAMDTNGDGKISRAEFMADAKAGKGDPATRFARLDRNGDGVVDKAEMDAHFAKRFARLDTNHDGLLSPDERAAGAHHPGKGASNGDGATS